MKKYKVITYAVCDFEYIVEADTKEKAKDLFIDGDYEEVDKGMPTDYHDETIDRVEEIKE